MHRKTIELETFLSLLTISEYIIEYLKISCIPWYLQIFHEIFRYSMIYSDIPWYLQILHEIWKDIKISRISKDIKDIKRYEKMGEELCCSCSCMHSIILYCTIQYNKIQYNTIQCITIVLFCIVFYCIVLYCISLTYPLRGYQKISEDYAAAAAAAP